MPMTAPDNKANASDASKSAPTSTEGAQTKLSAARAAVEHSSEAINELSTHWASAASTALWWDAYYELFTTKRWSSTYARLFGSFALFRGWQGVRYGLGKMRRILSPRRWTGPIQLPVRVPGDAIILPASGYCDGVVIVSWDERKVLKIVHNEASVTHLKKERQAWEIAQQAGITAHVPRLLDTGSLENRAEWMVSEAAPNTEPLYPIYEEQWRAWLMEEGLPVMARFHEAAGVVRSSASEMLQEVQTIVEKGNGPVYLEHLTRAVAEREAQTGDVVVVESLSHGDLLPRHVHRSGSDWWLIDWGAMKMQALFRELLRHHVRSPPERNTECQRFWAWLRYELPASQLTASMRSDIKLYLRWINEWLGLEQTPEQLRFGMNAKMLHEIAAIAYPDGEVTDLTTDERVEHIVSNPVERMWLYALCSKNEQFSPYVIHQKAKEAQA